MKVIISGKYVMSQMKNMIYAPFLATILAACGQTGELVLPPEKAEQAPQKQTQPAIQGESELKSDSK